MMYRYLVDIDDTPKTSPRPAAPSPTALVLIVIGAAGVIASIVGGLSLLASVFGAAEVIAAAIYFAVFGGLVFLTSGADRHWVVWPVRIIGPLPMTALFWWIFSLFGL